jgi:DNA-binding NarL/FixJ family response regulator/tetratricopeptide (TPR) repeat protein
LTTLIFTPISGKVKGVRVAERLIGRGEELASLHRALAEVESGHPRVIVLSGEPGIGKTRLLAELERLAEARGHLVFTGRASELERDLPYWLFVDALDEQLRSLAPDRRQRIDQRLGGELARIFPAMAGFDDAAGAVLDERYRAHWAVRELLERLAAAQPLVLVLDDLHWADPASVELLGGLLRRPPEAMVLLALALRPRQAPARLTAALEHADQAGGLWRRELPPLSRVEADELLGGNLQPHIARALYEDSGGDPFYLEQLVRAQQQTAHPTAGPETSVGSDRPVGGELQVPPAVAAALAQELDVLSSQARWLLQGAAVVGDPFEPELAATAAGEPDPEVAGAMDELLGLDLVRRTDTPRRFRFRHPLVRRAVHAATPDGWRMAAHARAARALAERGEPAAAQAHHVAQSARHGDRQAVALLREAADDAAQRAPASAARWYQAALELLPERAEPQERIRLLGALAPVLAGTGDFTRSRGVLLELLALVPAEATGTRVKLVATCAGVEHLLGQHAAAHARLISALDQLPDPNSADAAALLLDLAADAFYRQDFEQMRASAQRARTTAGPLGQAPLIAAAAASLSCMNALTGRIKEAEAHRAEAAATIDALPDAELGLRLDAISDLVLAEANLDRYQDTVTHAQRGLDVGRATGQDELFPQLIQSLGTALVMLGRLEEAAEVFDGAVEAARLSGNPKVISWRLFSRSWTAMLAGNLDLAVRTGEDAVDLERGVDQDIISPFVTGFLGAVLIEADEPARGLDLLISGAGGPELPLFPGVWRVFFHEVATRGWLALRQQPEAELAASRAETAAAALGLRSATALAGRARAAVTLATGDPAAAAEAALTSAAAADSIYAPIEAARARLLAGRALAAVGDRTSAAVELQQAAAAFDACGAIGYRDQAERALRRLGRRYQRPAANGNRGGLGSLTRRELEIAELVSTGKTNREIAAELFLSHKTVETHLRHIFAKLGISSRASVARALNR